jgi:hypothetical protein
MEPGHGLSSRTLKDRFRRGLSSARPRLTVVSAQPNPSEDSPVLISSLIRPAAGERQGTIATGMKKPWGEKNEEDARARELGNPEKHRLPLIRDQECP